MAGAALTGVSFLAAGLPPRAGAAAGAGAADASTTTGAAGAITGAIAAGAATAGAADPFVAGATAPTGRAPTTPNISRSAGGPAGARPRDPPRGATPRAPIPRGACGSSAAAALASAFCASSTVFSCSTIDAASAARATSKSFPRRRRSIMFASCASCRMRSNMRELNDSLSRPSRSNAFVRAALALVESSPCTSASTARRTRSKASLRVRRSPLLPM